MRTNSDEAYVIDICDKALGRRALRGQRFPFLKGDTGRQLPVDAYYPDLHLVVEYRERQHSEATPFFDRRLTASGTRGDQRAIYDQRRRDVLPENGISLVELDYSQFPHDSRKRLKRMPENMEIVRASLKPFLPNEDPEKTSSSCPSSASSSPTSARDSFPPGIAERLQTYVYRLIDPRNGETFYVGKGRGDRVFSHIREQVEGDDPNNKLKRIREIHLSALEVGHVIHRHGMDDKTAVEVEASLIDAYPGLTNIAGGAGSSEFGAMHAEEIIRRHAAEPAKFAHRALLINVNKSAAEGSLYEATRYAWKISPQKAKQAQVVLSTLQGLIVGAFVADNWLPAITKYFPGRQEMPSRFGFVGREAPYELRQLYVGKRVPDELRKRGSANPVRYTW